MISTLIERLGPDPELTELLRRSVEHVAAMTPAEREAMYEAQRQSWIRGMSPCEHGDYDWETCPDCLRALKHREQGK